MCEYYKINGSKIWEVQEGIITKILSILDLALIYICVCTFIKGSLVYWISYCYVSMYNYDHYVLF